MKQEKDGTVTGNWLKVLNGNESNGKFKNCVGVAAGCASYFNQHAQQRLLVLGPQCCQLVSRREQTAASVHSDFWAVAKVHAEILR